MNHRQALETGGWFDRSTADIYEEATYWDGSNLISRATGRQWTHEALYRTRKGRWVLHHWSQGEGSPDTWREAHDEDALRWLIANDHHAAAEQYGGTWIADLEV